MVCVVSSLFPIKLSNGFMGSFVVVLSKDIFCDRFMYACKKYSSEIVKLECQSYGCAVENLLRY